MAALGANLAAQLLNVALKQTASVVSPATLGLGLCLGTPSSISMSEVLGGSNYLPQSLTMSSVAANGTIASNANAMTFSFLSAATIVGAVVKNSLLAANAGTPFFFGTLNSTIILAAADTITFAAGALTISVS